jgi:hypothetical protein
MTRARPHTSSDNPRVEQKNGDILRKSAFRYRYDTPTELALLNDSGGYVNLRKNMSPPTKKANGWQSMKSGRNTRTYDAPKTPYQRLIDADFLTHQQERRLAELYERTNPADLTRPRSKRPTSGEPPAVNDSMSRCPVASETHCATMASVEWVAMMEPQAGPIVTAAAASTTS